MDNDKFLKLCKELVKDYTNEYLNNEAEINENAVYCVWLCRTLGNNKALLSTTLFDGMYYEVTFNGNKNEIYLDAYKKFENKCIEIPKEG